MFSTFNTCENSVPNIFRNSVKVEKGPSSGPSSCFSNNSGNKKLISLFMLYTAPNFSLHTRYNSLGLINEVCLIYSIKNFHFRASKLSVTESIITVFFTAEEWLHYILGLNNLASLSKFCDWKCQILTFHYCSTESCTKRRLGEIIIWKY